MPIGRSRSRATTSRGRTRSTANSCCGSALRTNVVRCRWLGAAALAFGLALATSRTHPARSESLDDPRYTAAGRLLFPARYRNWIFLSSGIDMSYAKSMDSSMHMFENVFVDPSAFAAFQRTGTWPDRTTLVTEFRSARGKGSINRAGSFQTTVMGYDVHVKDAGRFPGDWAFFSYDPGDASSAKIPASASCYACHSSHAAVDTTFVQFYPTLLPIAIQKHTLSAAYERENADAR